MRQPHSAKAASPSAARKTRMTTSARKRPTVAVVWIQRRVQAALAIGRVLGDIDRRAAVLAAERETLEHAQRHEDDRRQDADLRVAGQEADQDGGAAHDRDGQQEGVPCGRSRRRCGRRRSRRTAERRIRRRRSRARSAAGRSGRRGKKIGARNGGEHGVEVEVVPLDDRADGRRADDERDLVVVGCASDRPGARQ